MKHETNGEHKQITLDDLKAYHAARIAIFEQRDATPEQRATFDRLAPVDMLAFAIDLIEQAQADNAALVAVLKGVKTCDAEPGCIVCRAFADEALAQPHPGARMLEELEALRKVEEAAGNYHQALLEIEPRNEEECKAAEALQDALSEAYAIRNREGR